MSNINELKPIISLNPFARFCCTIGNLPSSYMASLTYEEQLLWLCDYLQNTVIPTVNNNAEVVKELQELYVKLKNYVDNYFENLDVQNEINHKLDEMVQDGTLQEIITSYLKTNGIIAFNNVNEMINSENLINGTFVKTYGTDFLNDGYGNFYKIRNITSNDVIDNINIIKINNSDILIAELIKDNNINNLLKNQKQLQNITKLNNGLFLGSFFRNNDTKLQLVVSKDGFNWTKILTNVIDKVMRDPSIIYYNGKFLIAYTNSGENFNLKIYESSDLINWEDKEIDLGIRNKDAYWAPEFFVDDDNTLYILISAGTPNTNMKSYISKCIDKNNLIFENAKELNLGLTNIIDNSMCKVNGNYYLAVSQQSGDSNNIYNAKSTVYILQSTDLINWNIINNNYFNTTSFVEGVCLLNVNNRFILYGDNTISFHKYMFSQTSNLSLNNNYLQYDNSLSNLRHGSVTFLNDLEGLDKIYNATKINKENINLYNLEKNYKSTVLIVKSIDNLNIEPDIIYQIGGTDKTITITNIYNPYAINEFPFVFTKRPDAQLVITNIQNTEGIMKNINRTLNSSSSANEKVFHQSLIGNCYSPYIP